MKSRLLGLFTTITIAGCTTANNTEMEINRTYNFEEMLLIPVEIQGKSYQFVVDTGAEYTVLSPKIARTVSKELKVNELPDFYQTKLSFIKGVSGHLDKRSFKVNQPVRFSLAGQEIQDNVLAISLDLHFFYESLGRKVDGVIGLDTFRQLSLVVNNTQNQYHSLNVAPSPASFSHCTSYIDNGRLMVITLEHDDYSITVGVDLGANQSYVGRALIDDLNQYNEMSLYLASNRAKTVDVTGYHDKEEYIIKGLSFNSFSLGELAVTVNEQENYAVGLDFLSRFDRYAFLPHQMLFCYDAVSIEETWSPPLRELRVRAHHNVIEVAFNDNVDLDLLGLKNGDVIVAANGKHYSDSDIGKLRKLFTEVPLNQIELTILRGETQINLTI